MLPYGMAAAFMKGCTPWFCWRPTTQGQCTHTHRCSNQPQTLLLSLCCLLALLAMCATHRWWNIPPIFCIGCWEIHSQYNRWHHHYIILAWRVVGSGVIPHHPSAHHRVTAWWEVCLWVCIIMLDTMWCALYRIKLNIYTPYLSVLKPGSYTLGSAAEWLK